VNPAAVIALRASGLSVRAIARTGDFTQNPCPVILSAIEEAFSIATITLSGTPEAFSCFNVSGNSYGTGLL